MPTTQILEAVVGSTLFGTQSKYSASDTDLLGVTIERIDEAMGFSTKDTWTYTTKKEGERSKDGDVDSTVYGLKKFLSLALKNNPTIISALFIPDKFIKYKTSEWDELVDLTDSIVCKRAYFPFSGYMRQQYERLIGERGQKNVTRPELVEKFGYDTKYAGHVIRLGYQGIELLKTGKITLPMPKKERQTVINIRNGQYFLDKIDAMIKDIEKELYEAYIDSKLPEEPDSKKVEDWMLNAYIQAWGWDA